jgi:hypothetical protein
MKRTNSLKPRKRPPGIILHKAMIHGTPIAYCSHERQKLIDENIYSQNVQFNPIARTSVKWNVYPLPFSLKIRPTSPRFHRLRGLRPPPTGHHKEG